MIQNILLINIQIIYQTQSFKVAEQSIDMLVLCDCFLVEEMQK